MNWISKCAFGTREDLWFYLSLLNKRQARLLKNGVLLVLWLELNLMASIVPWECLGASENCAVVHATGWANTLTKVACKKTWPGENDDHSTIAGAIICRSNNMAFLTAFFVDQGFGLGEHIFPLSSACDDLEIVQSFALSSLVLGKVSWAWTSAVGDCNVDSFAFVGMGILKKWHTQKLVRWNELGEPCLCLIDEYRPLLVFPSESLDTWETFGVSTTCIP